MRCTIAESILRKRACVRLGTLRARPGRRDNARMGERAKLGLAAAVFVALAYFVLVEWHASQNRPAPAFAQSAVTHAVRADLMRIARAQQVYLVDHNRFGSVPDLIASGALTMKTPGRGVYVYEAEVTAAGFVVTARATGEEAGRWPVLSINERMEITEEPATAGRK